MRERSGSPARETLDSRKDGGHAISLEHCEVGPWQWITLVRRGNTLYGVANDPAIQSAVMLRFDRDGGSGATAVEQ